MTKDEYDEYRKMQGTRSNPSYGAFCFSCHSDAHFERGGREYKVEVYKFNDNKTRTKPRRIIFCAKCWANIAGEEYCMDWK